MSSISIHNWKQTDVDGAGFQFIEPQYHPTYWPIKRWWYKGANAPYVSCARVDYSGALNTYQVFIDGTTPLMNLKVEWTGTTLELTEERDIRRVMICQDFTAVNQGSDEYMDIEYVDRVGWVVRKNGLPDPVIDTPPTWLQDPVWISSDPVELGETASAQTGSYEGGMPKSDGTQPLFRARWQVRNAGGTVTSGAWINNPEELEVLDLNTPAAWWPNDASELRLQNQVRDYDPTTDDVRTSNKFIGWRSIENNVTHWGAVIAYVNDVEYSFFLSPTLNVETNDPINLRVEWDGDATGTILWSQGGNRGAEFDDATSATPVVTFTGIGPTVLTFTLTDPSGKADPVSVSKSLNFFAADP